MAKQPIVADMKQKLAALLSQKQWKSSADVIDAFTAHYPTDWATLVEKYGDRDDEPGTGPRGHFYAASTYVADRLSDMKRMGLVERGYTLDFDQERWRHTKRMGKWRLLVDGDDVIKGAHGATKVFTMRIPERLHLELHRRAQASGKSAAAYIIDLIERAR